MLVLWHLCNKLYAVDTSVLFLSSRLSAIDGGIVYRVNKVYVFIVFKNIWISVSGGGD